MEHEKYLTFRPCEQGFFHVKCVQAFTKTKQNIENIKENIWSSFNN